MLIKAVKTAQVLADEKGYDLPDYPEEPTSHADDTSPHFEARLRRLQEGRAVPPAPAAAFDGYDSLDDVDMRTRADATPALPGAPLLSPRLPAIDSNYTVPPAVGDGLFNRRYDHDERFTRGDADSPSADLELGWDLF